MKLKVDFPQTHFPASAVRQICKDWQEVNTVSLSDGQPLKLSATANLIHITREGESWTFDKDDLEEFFNEYDRGFTEAWLSLSGTVCKDPVPTDGGFYVDGVSLTFEQHSWVARVSFQSSRRDKILEAASRVRALAEQYKVSLPDPSPVRPQIFIGHGHAPDWERLYRHLKDHHSLDVFAYETEERAGQSIQDFLGYALNTANFAVVVMTGDDEMDDGGVRARQNVVHEAGLFQGRLGFGNVILVAEQGIESLSNLAGIQELRFDRGNIESVAGRFLAILRRRFPGGI